ncbi:hypothetical protein HPB48_012054 [Haemaphysalis longicornis]|uniref:Uncharacterized protein n=1 Tax=Haemaphysalis longicornis TaxID=44386 RepID=A0A9J6H3K7_HAELO|nr:hypothetical protein HPB48_012054 [Haemaphysalis longicornis]
MTGMTLLPKAVLTFVRRDIPLLTLLLILVRDSKQRNGRPSVEEELSGLGNDDMLLGIGLTPDFMETSNPESFRMPQLKSDDLPLRFPQLAQLDLPAFRDGN